MSLAVARQINGIITILSDTHLTNPVRKPRQRLVQGVIKSRILNDSLCVSFAGIKHWAKVGLSAVEKQPLAAADEVAATLLRIHEQSSQSTDFLIAAADPQPRLIEITNGQAKTVVTSWLGSAFSHFQGYATGALTPPDIPLNTFEIQALQTPEGPRGETDPDYEKRMTALRYVIEDSSVPEVGGFAVPVGLHQGRFQYMEYTMVLTHPIRFDLMPQEFVVPFGTAAEGGYGFNLMPDPTSGSNGLAVYFLQGRYGVAFTPKGGLLRPIGFRNVSPLEFEEEISGKLGLHVLSMFTKPEEHCSCAMSFLDSNDWDRALAEADRAVARGDKIAASWRCRGAVHGRRGELDSAVADFSQAISLEPGHAPTWYNRGIALRELGRFQKAFDDFSRAIDIAPEYARAYQYRAMAARNLGDLDRAVADEKSYRVLTQEGGAN